MFNIKDWAIAESEDGCTLSAAVKEQKEGGWSRDLGVMIGKDGYAVYINSKQLYSDIPNVSTVLECEPLENIHKSIYRSLLITLCRKYLKVAEVCPWLKEIGGN